MQSIRPAMLMYVCYISIYVARYAHDMTDDRMFADFQCKAGLVFAHQPPRGCRTMKQRGQRHRPTHPAASTKKRLQQCLRPQQQHTIMLTSHHRVLHPTPVLLCPPRSAYQIPRIWPDNCVFLSQPPDCQGCIKSYIIILSTISPDTVTLTEYVWWAFNTFFKM